MPALADFFGQAILKETFEWTIWITYLLPNGSKAEGKEKLGTHKMVSKLSNELSWDS